MEEIDGTLDWDLVDNKLIVTSSTVNGVATITIPGDYSATNLADWAYSCVDDLKEWLANLTDTGHYAPARGITILTAGTIQLQIYFWLLANAKWPL